MATRQNTTKDAFRLNPGELRVYMGRMYLTQTALAQMLGVHKQTVRGWTNGDHPIPVYVAVMLDLMENVPGVRERLADT